MRFTHILKSALILLFVILAIAFINAKTSTMHRDTSTPVVFEVNPPNPGPDSQVTIDIELDNPSSTGTIVTIGSTDPAAFVNLPSEVIVPAGTAGTTFTARTSSVYTRWTVLAATANGGTALAVQP